MRITPGSMAVATAMLATATSAMGLVPLKDLLQCGLHSGL